MIASKIQRDPVSKNKVGSNQGKDETSISGPHMHLHTCTYTKICTHTETFEPSLPLQPRQPTENQAKKARVGQGNRMSGIDPASQPTGTQSIWSILSSC